MILLAVLQFVILLLMALFEIQLGNLWSFLSLMPGLTLMTLCVLKGWPRLVPELEPEIQDKWAEIVGEPKFDPSRGIYAEILVGTEKFKVLMQPNWWPYFSPAVTGAEKEGACYGSVVSPVDSGKEPGFLVVLQNAAGETKGMGSRVRINGKSLLVTAYHVTEMTDKLYIAKYNKNEGVGKRLLVDPNWIADFACKDRDVDIIGIEVPAKIWSSLGVTEAKAKIPSLNRVPISVYGADKASQVKSSQSTALVQSNFSGVHTATTTQGWSGSPVVSNGFVIGVHRGTDRENFGVNKFTCFHSILLFPNVETLPDEGHNSQIDEEEAASRPYEFDSVKIHGRGWVNHTKNEWFMRSVEQNGPYSSNYKPLSGGRAWADIANDDDGDDVDWQDAEGASDDVPLNSQGVSSVVPTLTPLKELAATDLNIPSCSPPKEWDYTSLESRVLVSEKLLEQVLKMQSSTQEQLSQICVNLTGLSVAVEQSSIRFSSRPAGTPKPETPTTSSTPLESSVKSIPERSKGPVSKETGTPTSSKRPSRRSRRGKSKVTPPQESPLPQ